MRINTDYTQRNIPYLWVSRGASRAAAGTSHLGCEGNSRGRRVAGLSGEQDDTETADPCGR